MKIGCPIGTAYLSYEFSIYFFIESNFIIYLIESVFVSAFSSSSSASFINPSVTLLDMIISYISVDYLESKKGCLHSSIGKASNEKGADIVNSLSNYFKLYKDIKLFFAFCV